MGYVEPKVRDVLGPKLKSFGIPKYELLENPSIGSILRVLPETTVKVYLSFKIKSFWVPKYELHQAPK